MVYDRCSTRVLGTWYQDWHTGPQNSGLLLDELMPLGARRSEIREPARAGTEAVPRTEVGAFWGAKCQSQYLVPSTRVL
jgi:hypothetical protein